MHVQGYNCPDNFCIVWPGKTGTVEATTYREGEEWCIFGSEVSICLQCRRPGFDPWVRKIPWRRKWQSTPVFLSGESHGGRSLVGYSPGGCKESDTTERLHFTITLCQGFPGGSAGKESTCNVGGLGSTPGLGTSLGQGKGYPLQYSDPENSMDGIVHGLTKSRTQLSDFHFHSVSRSLLRFSVNPHGDPVWWALAESPSCRWECEV